MQTSMQVASTTPVTRPAISERDKDETGSEAGADDGAWFWVVRVGEETRLVSGLESPGEIVKALEV